MISIAIVDDEEVIREQIKQLAERISIDQNIKNEIFLYSSGKEFLDTKKQPDIIFLDIQMDGINGIDLAKEFRKQNKESKIIFITAIKEYVFDAFEVAAFYFLLKPVAEEKFTEIFTKAVCEVEQGKKQKNKQIFIQSKNRNITLKQNSILYIENRLKKVEIHTMKDRIEIYATMKELEQQLGENFYRCHRGYLVNMSYIEEYNSSMITLNNGEMILMSKEKYSDFVKAYMSYLRNGGIMYV